MCTLWCALIGNSNVDLTHIPGKWCPERFLASQNLARHINAHLVVRTNWKFKREFCSYSRYGLENGVLNVS